MKTRQIRQLCIGLLIPLLFSYLAVATELQLSLDLAEAVEHLDEVSLDGSPQLIPLAHIGHECHSCLASHPNVSVNAAEECSVSLDLKKNGRPSALQTVFRTTRHQSGFSARSPPAQMLYS